jgi:polyisoprenoid-binding protein YceI
MKRSPFLVSALLVAALSAPALAADFTLDKAHTQAEFVVTHLTLSKVHGQIPLANGTASITPDGLPAAIDATFDLTNVVTQNDRRDADLRKNYFEVDKFPTITFVEKSAKGKPASFTMTGDLTIHGVTKPVTVATTLDATATVRGKKHYAYSGTTKIHRRDFGMSFGPLLDGALIAGYDVRINFETDAIEN